MNKDEELAYIAWNEYYDIMARRFDMQMDRRTLWTNKFHKSFLAIGRLCLTHDLDVSDYISVSLDTMTKNRKYITPADFIKPQTLQAYFSIRERAGERVERQWVNQVNEFTTMECELIPRLYKSDKHIMLDPRMPFYAWFRVLYLTPFDEDIFTAHGAHAWSQLRQDNKLRTFLRQVSAANVAQLEARLGPLDRLI